MPKEFLQIEITADNSQAVAELNELGGRLKTFEAQIKKATDAETLIRLQKSISDTKAKMETLNSSINPLIQNTQKFAAGSNQAAQALTNVGRVAQDLPFGFIGIQNNLNPLLESFQRLKAETGSGSTALKALAGSLMGAGGVGLALSVVSSAFLIYQNGIMGFNRKTTEAKEKLDKFTESLNQNREAAAKDMSSMSAYVDAAQNTSLSIEQRQSAVDKLIQQYPAYFKGLTVENALTKDLTQSTNSLTEAIYKRAAARAMEGDVAAAANDVFREQEKLDKLRLDIEKAQADLAQQRSKPSQIGGGGTLGGMSAGAVDGAVLAEKSLNVLLQQQDRLLTSIDQKKVGIAQKQLRINALTAQTINLDAASVKKDTGLSTTGAPKEKLETFHGKQIYAEAAVVQQHLLDVQKEMYTLTQKQYDIDIKREALIRMGGNLYDAKFAGTQNTALAEGVAQKQAVDQQMILGIEQSRKSALDDINQRFLKQQVLVQSVGNAFQNLFADVAKADNPFEALTNAVKQLVLDLAAAAAKMFLINALMKAINPAVGAAKGIGGILGSIIGGGFAKGGVSYGPQGGHMELLHGTEAVLTPAQMSGLVRNSMNAGAMSSMGQGGSNSTPIIMDTRLVGNDIWLSQRRTEFSRNLRT